MNRIKTILMMGVGVVAATAAAQAQDGVTAQSATATNGQGTASTTTTTSAVTNSDSNYLDDRLTWDRSVRLKSADSFHKGSDADYCLPAGTAVIGESSSMSTSTTTPASNGSTAQSVPADKYLPITVDPNRVWWGFGGDSIVKANQTIASAASANPPGKLCNGMASAPQLVSGDTYYITAEDVGNVTDRMGWDYGTLFVPFKMQLSGKNSFSGSSMIGGYVGYTMPLWNWGIKLSPVLFAGASNISVPKSGSTSEAETVAGLSYGFGLVTTVKGNFQMGLIFGADHVDSDNYQYNNKPWISFEIGYSFAR